MKLLILYSEMPILKKIIFGVMQPTQKKILTLAGFRHFSKEKKSLHIYSFFTDGLKLYEESTATNFRTMTPAIKQIFRGKY